MNCLITGGNSGIGLATARCFIDSDPENVIFLGVHRNRSEAEAFQAEFAPGCVHILSLDVTDPASWNTAVESILASHQRLDVLVNNAGFHKDALLATMSDSDWQSVIQGNLDSVFYGCRAVTRPMMANRFGRIINVSSLSALFSPAGQTNYAAAKAGVIALTQSLAKETARAGITVNAVCPGYIETDALSAIEPEKKRQISHSIPMRRIGKPDEVAAAIFFLSSRMASYITGSVLKVDGGIF